MLKFFVFDLKVFASNVDRLTLNLENSTFNLKGLTSDLENSTFLLRRCTSAPKKPSI